MKWVQNMRQPHAYDHSRGPTQSYSYHREGAYPRTRNENLSLKGASTVSELNGPQEVWLMVQLKGAPALPLKVVSPTRIRCRVDARLGLVTSPSIAVRPHLFFDCGLSCAIRQTPRTRVH